MPSFTRRDNTKSDSDRKPDPQIVVTGKFLHSENSDIIVFSFRLAFFEIVCIATVPEEGQDTAPCYIKFRMFGPKQTSMTSIQRDQG